MNCIGLDVHQTSTFGSVVREGREVFRFEVATQAEDLQKAIGQIEGAKRVAVEEGNLSDWCKRTLEGVVNEVIICDPRWNRLISEGEDKVDPVDAYRLGLLLWLGQLRPVYHADLELQQLKEAVISYWQSSADLTRAKNRLKSQFARRGLAIKDASVYREEGFQRARQQLEESWGQTQIVDSLFEQVSFSRQQQAERLRHLRQQQRNHLPILRQLRTIPGVGPIVAVTFFSFIGDPWRFANKRKLWKYCGLAVKHPFSGGRRTGYPRRSQQYNRKLKHVLGIATQAALRCQNGNSLAQTGQLLVQQGKAASAVRRTLSRKIAVIAWSIMKDPQPYREEVCEEVNAIS
jgi:transposase